MITQHEQQLAESAAIGLLDANDDDAFNWQQFYSQKAEGFAQAAKTWRTIADTCQRAGDDDGVRMAHMAALENENYAKEAELKARQHA